VEICKPRIITGVDLWAVTKTGACPKDQPEEEEEEADVDDSGRISTTYK
jgi:hypothetical protein